MKTNNFFKKYWWNLLCLIVSIWLLWWPETFLDLFDISYKQAGFGIFSKPLSTLTLSKVVWIGLGLLISTSKMFLGLLWSALVRIFKKK
ncbi:hypothetical protein HN954_03545 [bacterium]|jgi:hypothetical protein|nr:hypothetical protein [bacterium]MBT6996477.1 hypothetical protein [bacterium]MBT7772505.1 hypothetical protein [bacterium]